MDERVRNSGRAALAALAVAAGLSLAAAKPASAATVSGTIITNLAEVIWGDAYVPVVPTTAAVTATAYVEVIPVLLDITILKSQNPANPQIGELVTYQIVVTNTGLATVTDITVVDTISPVVVNVFQDTPSGFTALAPAQVSSGTRYEWSASAPLLLGPGASFTFTITGAVSDVCLPTTVSNTVFVSASNADSATVLTR